jgi:flagellar basal-body rod protein FlgB
MYDNILQHTTIPVLEQLASFSQARHTVLAGNIANMDTPGYQARDLSVDDFQTRLAKAIEARHQPPLALSPGDPDATDAPDMAQVAKNSETILRHDGSNVGMEYQVSEMVKNQMQHNLALTIMASQFRVMQAAISERA